MAQDDERENLLERAQNNEQVQQITSRFDRVKHHVITDYKQRDFIPQVCGEFIGMILFNYMIQSIGITVATTTSSPYVATLTSSIYTAIFFTLLYLILQPITGMFVNPSIVLNFVFIGKLSVVRGVLIIIAELLGAMVGAGLVALSYSNKSPHFLGVNDLPPGQTASNAFWGELVGTFIFNIAIIGHLDADFGINSKVGSLTVGGTLGFLVFIIGPISSGSLNPARTLGPAFVYGYFRHAWLYVLGPSIGGILAGQVYTRLMKYPLDD